MIKNPNDSTDSQRLKKLHQCNDEKIQVQKVLELIEEHNRQKSQDVVSRVIDLVGNGIARGHLSIAEDRPRRFLDCLEKPVLEILEAGRILFLVRLPDDGVVDCRCSPRFFG